MGSRIFRLTRRRSWSPRATSWWWQTTSDSAFGDLGAGYPEIAVGRIPANDPGEAASIVTHILKYNGFPSSGWQAQAVADVLDPDAGDFAAEADSVIAANPVRSMEFRLLHHAAGFAWR